MLAKKKSVRGAFFVLTLALLLSGCTPAGPRALLKGKKYLDHGDVAAAVTQFRRATTLLSTNANAWNYYGVALQRAGQPEEAAGAYQNALRLDHDLVEVHFNLGLLWLEQNRPDLARAELTTYTLRRQNDAAGWLKLGFAQLRAGDPMQAERSFSTVRALRGDDPEAYNGFGLACIQLGKPRDAAQFFAAAVQVKPDFAPALLNLAAVNQEYLHDNRTALANYQAYLALTPRPASYNEVKIIVAGLLPPEAPPVVLPPVVVAKSAPQPKPAPQPAPVQTPPSEPKLRAVATVTPGLAPASHPETPSRTEPKETRASRAETVETPRSSHSPQRTSTILTSPRTTPVVPQPAPNARVPAEPRVIVPSKTNSMAPRTVLDTPPPATNEVAVTDKAATDNPDASAPEEQPRHGFWHRLFNSDKSGKRYREDSASAPSPSAAPVTPPPAPETKVTTTAPETTPAAPAAPAAATPATTATATTTAAAATPATEEMAGTKAEEDKPADTKPAPPPVFPRYTYTSPQLPAAGDRRTAEGAFTKGRLAEQDEDWEDAAQMYQMAADTDPAWFEAQYNAGVLAHRQHHYSAALPRYELALAIRPDSVDARYNFALVLTAAGFPTDAADQFKKILTTNSDEVRAHLALANLCAQSLRDVPQAREHYLRVLELQPKCAQANDIRFWLTANARQRNNE